ncbi:MAG: hypothetical protein NZ480_08990 [Bdellovibrionaceae bacterium]|nr:hypothetical protein [Pseudobdellovibrionaceae bacterium]
MIETILAVALGALRSLEIINNEQFTQYFLKLMMFSSVVFVGIIVVFLLSKKKSESSEDKN